MDGDAAGFRRGISLLLRYGVVSSFVIVAIGSALLFAQAGTGYSGMGSAQELVDTAAFPVAPAAVADGVLAAKPFAVIEFGLLVLFATPLVRVAASIPLFVKERRYAFVAITTAVLSVLLLSIFVVAPFLAG